MDSWSISLVYHYENPLEVMLALFPLSSCVTQELCYTPTNSCVGSSKSDKMANHGLFSFLQINISNYGLITIS